MARRAIIVKGHLSGRRIELDEPVMELEGEVEVCLRAAPVSALGEDFFHWLRDFRLVIVRRTASIGNSERSVTAGPNVSNTYLDACCFIYWVEGDSSWRQLVGDRLRVIGSTVDARVVTSQLSRLECRTKPIREGDGVLLGKYDTLFGSRRLEVLDVTPLVIDQATRLRAKYGFSAPAINDSPGVPSCRSRFYRSDSGTVVGKTLYQAQRPPPPWRAAVAVLRAPIR